MYELFMQLHIYSPKRGFGHFITKKKKSASLRPSSNKTIMNENNQNHVNII